MLDLFAGRRAKKKIENVEFAKETERLKKKHPQLSLKEREALAKEKLSKNKVGKQSKVGKAISAGAKEIGKQLEPQPKSSAKKTRKTKPSKSQTVKVVVESAEKKGKKKSESKKKESGFGMKDFGRL